MPSRQTTATVNTNGVEMTGDLPAWDGLPTGRSVDFTLDYLVPQGVVNYRTTFYFTASDSCGNHYYYPGPPPVT